MTPVQRVAGKWVVRAGQFQAPPALVKGITKWALRIYARHLLALIPEERASTEGMIQDFRSDPEMDDDDIEFELKYLGELKKTAKWLRKFASKPKRRRGTHSKAFPLDLSGWRYLEGDPKLQDEVQYWGRIQGWSPVNVHMVFDGWKHGLSKAFISFSSSGVFINAPKPLDFAIKGPTGLRRVFEEMPGSVRHEIQHLGQRILSSAKGALVGLPSRKVQETEPATKLPHALLDSEYHTRLSDEIAEFTRMAKRNRLDGEALQQAIQAWTSGKRSDIPSFGYVDQEFWRYLVRANKPKWRAATKTFFSEVMKSFG